jgi:hypothetical protein
MARLPYTRFLLVSTLAAGCTARVVGSPPDGNPASGNDAGTQPAQAAYPGHGFIVHEWGTDTIVVGSDGSLQRGLHHEQEDLPPFVYDRIKAGRELMTEPSVAVKMETPVTYFYSDKPLAANVSVSFPHGVFTQWYPRVDSFRPPIAGPGSEPSASNQPTPSDYADPTLDIHFPFSQQSCRDTYTAIEKGSLDWGSIEVLPRAAPISPPDAPLGTYSWSYARHVASNPVRTSDGQVEQFLFYRGLGNFDPPVKVTALDGGSVTLANGYGETMGAIFVLNVDASTGAFAAYPQGLAADASMSAGVPPLDRKASLDTYADALGASVTSALDAVGLYHDESTAMVDTWKAQWFRTPGVRVLYIAPQSWTDASIPLAVQPVPDAIRRVMLIRVEVLTPEVEKADMAQAQGLGSPVTAPQAQAYFLAQGRFAEPRLRRALTLLDNPTYGQSLLAQVATANTSVTSGE